MWEDRSDLTLCISADLFEDLTGRLKGLELEAGGAPLLNIVEGASPPPWEGGERQSSLEQGGVKGEEQWELL